MNRFSVRICVAVLSAMCLMGTMATSVLADTPSLHGDVNADGSFDAADVRMLQQHLLGAGTVTVPNAADYDASGIVDAADLTAMKRALLYPESVIDAPIRAMHDATPSQGDVKMLAFYVDFADQTYGSQAYSNDAIEEELFGNGAAPYPYDSVTNWFARASYGNLHIDGTVYRYTCSKNMADYQNDQGFEALVMEVLSGLDHEIDFSDYDSNQDGIIDCMAFTVPLDDADSETLRFWWGCTATWYQNSDYRVDDMQIKNYIIMDVMPYASDMQYLKQTLIHEMGHSMGLPDYYKYQTNDDWEGLHGDAGYTRMDDSIGDFCGFDKLMYGWLMPSEIQSYEGTGEQTFILNDASLMGSCLLLPISSVSGDYFSEYFLVEYISNSANNSDIYAFNDSSGIRILHVQAEVFTDYWDRTNFKYENYSEHYMGDDKIRVLQLVNDRNGFYHTGDTIAYGVTNFAAYDTSGDQTIDTGYTITIGAQTDAGYTVTVSRN